MIKKTISIFIVLFYLEASDIAAKEINTISALLTATVTTTVDQQKGFATPIPNARIVVIDSMTGKIIGTVLTNSNGEAKIPVTAQKDPRFPSKTMGEVTVIAFANGYNEYINFSVPINEYSDHTARVFMTLLKIDPSRRNEPQFLNGSFHRFTVFKMLDEYAKRLGLNRQNVNDPSIDPAPWGPH